MHNSAQQVVNKVPDPFNLSLLYLILDIRIIKEEILRHLSVLDLINLARVNHLHLSYILNDELEKIHNESLTNILSKYNKLIQIVIPGLRDFDNTYLVLFNGDLYIKGDLTFIFGYKKRKNYLEFKKIKLVLEPHDRISWITAHGHSLLIYTKRGRLFVSGFNDEGQLGLGQEAIAKDHSIPLTEIKLISLGLDPTDKIMQIKTAYKLSVISTKQNRIFVCGLYEPHFSSFTELNLESEAIPKNTEITAIFPLPNEIGFYSEGSGTRLSTPEIDEPLKGGDLYEDIETLWNKDNYWVNFLDNNLEWATKKYIRTQLPCLIEDIQKIAANTEYIIIITKNNELWIDNHQNKFIHSQFSFAKNHLVTTLKIINKSLILFFNSGIVVEWHIDKDEKLHFDPSIYTIIVNWRKSFIRNLKLSQMIAYLKNSSNNMGTEKIYPQLLHNFSYKELVSMKLNPLEKIFSQLQYPQSNPIQLKPFLPFKKFGELYLKELCLTNLELAAFLILTALFSQLVTMYEKVIANPKEINLINFANILNGFHNRINNLELLMKTISPKNPLSTPCKKYSLSIFSIFKPNSYKNMQHELFDIIQNNIKNFSKKIFSMITEDEIWGLLSIAGNLMIKAIHSEADDPKNKGLFFLKSNFSKIKLNTSNSVAASSAAPDPNIESKPKSRTCC